MPAFSDYKFQPQHGNPMEEISELQNAIREITDRRLEVEEKTQRLLDDKSQCAKEILQRAMIKESGVVDDLQQLGHLLKKEKHLAEQLNGPASADRINLQKTSEIITNRSRSLAAEILEVKEQLAEAKARNMAAQALIHPPTRKSKRNQRKPK